MTEQDFITGAGGFIGGKLRERLPKAQVVHHDQIDFVFFRNIQRFFFLSAYGNMAQHKSPEKILKANVLDLGNIISHMMKYGQFPEFFLYMSSSSVNLPVQTMYSRTKRAGEEMLQASSLPACIVRPYSCTGIGEQKEHLIPTIIRSCMDGEEMQLVPDAVHDYIDVSDVCDALIILADKKAQGVFELGTGIGWSNRDVLETVEDICGKKANVKFVDSPLRSYDNEHWFCRSFEAANYGWVPKKTLAHSISEMVEAYKK